MKYNIRKKDFELIHYCKNYIYATNRLSGECAVFNQEEELILYENFSDIGVLDSNKELEKWIKNPKILSLEFQYRSYDGFYFKKTGTTLIGLYSIEENSFIFPFSITHFRFINDVCILQTATSIITINNIGKIIGTITFSNCFETGLTQYSHLPISEKHEVLVINQDDKCGVYSWKENKFILPIEFEPGICFHDAGIIVTKKPSLGTEEMGIYSYNGEIILPLKKQRIYTFKHINNCKLLAISSNNRDSLYTENLHCIFSKKYVSLNVWHPLMFKHEIVDDGNFFILTDTPRHYEGLYSVLMKKFIVPSKYEKLILGKQITAIRRIFIPKSEFQSLYCIEDGELVILDSNDSTFCHISSNATYGYADIYSYTGELVKKNIVIVF